MSSPILQGVTKRRLKSFADKSSIYISMEYGYVDRVIEVMKNNNLLSE